ELSSGEVDAIKRAIAPCWNIDPGVLNYKSLQVHLRLTMNPDGTVREVTLMDTARYSTDTYYRAAVDSARRALTNPRCNKLPFPPDKYATWQITNLIFDPKDILQ
ncbi:MAG: cell envelope integrity protein TolA, partial [Alphaproteobacteria bacterium]|nr:cell envelope integrity protein TolA [Alphaproteobacteria bacterium]